MMFMQKQFKVITLSSPNGSLLFFRRRGGRGGGGFAYSCS